MLWKPHLKILKWYDWYQISQKHPEKTCVWERQSCYESLNFHLKRFETLLKHQFQHRRMSFCVGKKSFPTNGLPSPSGSPRTSHPRLHPCYVRRRPTDRSQFLCFFPGETNKRQTAGFTPRNWLVFGWFFLMCLRPFPKMKRGYFQVSRAVCFPGVWKIISPWIIFPRASWGMSGKHVGQKMEKTWKGRG